MPIFFIHAILLSLLRTLIAGPPFIPGGGSGGGTPGGRGGGGAAAGNGGSGGFLDGSVGDGGGV